MADSVEDRAAKAIRLEMLGSVSNYQSWDDMSVDERSGWKRLATAALQGSGLLQEIAALRKPPTLRDDALKTAGDLLHRSIEPAGHECSPGCKISADALAVIVIDAYLEAAAPTSEDESG